MRGRPLLFSCISDLFYQLFVSSLDPGLARWLSLAELPGEGGGPFLLCFRLFLTFLSIVWVPPCPWAGSLALARRAPRGGLPSLFSFMSDLFVHYVRRYLPMG